MNCGSLSLFKKHCRMPCPSAPVNDWKVNACRDSTPVLKQSFSHCYVPARSRPNQQRHRRRTSRRHCTITSPGRTTASRGRSASAESWRRTYAELILTSQTWHDIVWKHQLYVYRPKNGERRLASAAADRRRQLERLAGRQAEGRQGRFAARASTNFCRLGRYRSGLRWRSCGRCRDSQCSMVAKKTRSSR